MNNNEQNKFERLASLFHHEMCTDGEMQNHKQESEVSEDSDFLEVKKIFEAKDLVVQINKISPSEEAWKKVHSRINRKRFLKKIVYWQYAAAFVAIFLIIELFWGKNLREYFSEPEQFISEISAIGEIRNLTLPDGSNVWLNSGSILKYSNRFDKTDRLILVEGEALFKVVKEHNNPFTVTVGNSKIIVHGTIFNVNSYSSADKYEVVLVEGSVEYANSQKNIFIEPGERITEIKSSKNLVVDQVDPEKYISWISGKAYFDNKPLLDLVALLEKWYGVDFEFANVDAKSYTFTGMIDKKNSLDYVLQIIEMTNKVKFIKKGGKMLITN